jgi:aminoglycoside/choline kinase family phosphotransferase
MPDTLPPADRPFADREALKRDFLRQAGWGAADRRPLTQDASSRSYERLTLADRSVLLMDAPRLEAPVAPTTAWEAERNAMGWNARARLAACRVDAFVAVGSYLEGLGLSTPRVLAHHAGHGFALVEDLGDNLYARAVPAGADEVALYAEAGRALAVVQRAGIPKALGSRGGSWPLFLYDRLALTANADLFFEWQPAYDPGVRLTDADRGRWEVLRTDLVSRALARPRGFTVRDTMAENLLWLPEREGVRRVGLLDFQDALIGWPEWDFAMLIHDARRDVSPEAGEAAIRAFLDDTGLDEARFRESFSILGAINALRILGVFARLVHRDQKPKYAAFMDREWGHLASALLHPSLAELRAFLVPRCDPLGARISAVATPEVTP